MSLKMKQVGNVTVIELKGELDHAGMAAVKNAITSLLDEAKYRVVLDLHKVKTASLMHVGVLVDETRKLRRRGGDLKLVGLGGVLSRVFDSLGPGEVFSHFKKVDEALAEFMDRGSSS